MDNSLLFLFKNREENNINEKETLSLLICIIMMNILLYINNKLIISFILLCAIYIGLLIKLIINKKENILEKIKNNLILLLILVISLFYDIYNILNNKLSLLNNEYNMLTNLIINISLFIIKLLIFYNLE